MTSSDPMYEEKQKQYWRIYNEARRRLNLEILHGGTVCHIVARENVTVKIKRTVYHLLTRNWPLCGSKRAVLREGSKPRKEVHSICATCALVCQRTMEKLQQDTSND